MSIVSLQEAKLHLRVDHADEDALIQGMLDAAIDYLYGSNGVLGASAHEEAIAGFLNGIPSPIRVAILIHVATLYENRSQDANRFVPGGFYQSLVLPHRELV